MSEQQPISPLVADIITAQLTQSHATADALISSLTEEATRLRCELAAVREGVMELITGPYMPTPAAIQSALYPSSEYVAELRSEVES